MLNLSGMIPPVVSPLTVDRTADRASIERLAEHLVAGGSDGLFVLGSCGEGPTLTRSVARDVVDGFVAASAGRIPVLVGVGETSTERTVEAARDAEAAGAAAVVVMAPMYYDTGDDDEPTVRHIGAVADAVGIGVVVYNIPHLTHRPITPRALERVASIERVIALKESSGDWDVYAPLAATARENGLAVFQGAEGLVARSLAEGADGAVPGIANLVPDLAARLVAAGRSGQLEEAAALQDELDVACAVYQEGFWLTALKTAVAATGLIGATAGLALPTLDDGAVAAVRARLDAIGLLGTAAGR